MSTTQTPSPSGPAAEQRFTPIRAKAAPRPGTWISAVIAALGIVLSFATAALLDGALTRRRSIAQARAMAPSGPAAPVRPTQGNL